MIQYVVIALLGALASILANTGVAVFNDGFRPIVPEYYEGRMDRKELAATSFAISFGLVIGFGIPISLAASIILIHSILLGTDIIGTFCPAGKKGMIAAGFVGALYGVGIVAGLEMIVNLFAKLPINFLGSLGTVGSPVVLAFAVFPAVAVAMEYGIGKGLVTVLATFFVRQIFSVWNKIPFGADYSISLNKEGMALLTGMVFLIVYAVRDKSGADNSNEQLVAVFSAKVEKIRKNIPFLAAMGGLVSCATSMTLLAGDPISLSLLQEGQNVSAAMTALARAIGFIPLVATTAITTGVYSPVGMTFVFVIGLLVGNPVIAFVLGCLMIIVEVLFLSSVAKLLDKFPGVRKSGDNIRTAMSKVLEIALLIGGMMAAQQIAPGLGLFVVISFYVLNKYAKKPIVDIAVGPVGAIAVGILVNILHAIGLFPIA
jgi:hypothetical protein